MPSHSSSLLLSSMGNNRLNFRGRSWSSKIGSVMDNWVHDPAPALKINAPPNIVVQEPNYDARAC